jgi:hypothetical protein
MDLAGPTSRPLDRTYDLLCFSWYRQLLNLHVYHRLVSQYILTMEFPMSG